MLKITRVNEKAPNPKVVANQRLYRTHDGRLVPEGHGDAAFLFCVPGREVDLAEFESYRLDVPGDVTSEEVGPRRQVGAGEDAVSPGGEEGDEEKARKAPGHKRRKTRTEDK